MEIDKRIKELEAEIKEHQEKAIQFQQALQELQVTIISKQGAVLELKKLEPNKETDLATN